MVKEPRPGRVKTRLGAEIGMTNAAWWYRHQCKATLRRLRDPRWQLVLSVSPDIEGMKSRVWPRDLARMPQGWGGLDDRMRSALAAAPGPVVLIGSDIPGVTRGHIVRAFKALVSARSVVGPAKDGGFWLIGLSGPNLAAQSLFRKVAWSKPDTLVQTLPTLPAPVAFADEMQDVDSAADLPRGGRK